MDMQPNFDKGLLLLDAYVPKWYNNVNLLKFNIGNPCDCVLGQQPVVGHEYLIFGRGYFGMLAKLFPIPPGHDIENDSIAIHDYRSDRAREYGFLPIDHDETEQLKELWASAVNERRDEPPSF